MRSLSLQSRLVMLAAVTILSTLVLTGLVMRSGLSRTISVMVDAKMDAQIDAFRSRPARLADRPEAAAFLVDFDDPHSGWGWRVARGGGAHRGGLAFGAATPDPDDTDAHFGIVSGTARAVDGTAMRVRLRRSGGELVEVAAPVSIVQDALDALMRQTLLRVLAVTLGLIAAAGLALRQVMAPLRSLKEDIARIRAGTRQKLPVRQPPELKPLAAEINTLLEQNEAGLAHARQHVAKLAHGLKTPLATLALRLARDGAGEQTRALVADLDQRLERQLGRARAAAATAGGMRTRAGLGGVADRLVHTMRQLFWERGLEIGSAVPPDLVAQVDRQDLDEMLGNLLDNGCRHARTRVRLSVVRDGPMLVLAVEDDGPGLTEAEAAAALDDGVRLEVGRPGHGFGLEICRELAELHGGTLNLDRSPALGGLRARLRLPGR